VAYRSVHTKIWSDPWFTEISADAQHLFLYLLTNEHRRESGFYPLSLKTMSFETNRPVEQIKTLLEELSEKVKYDHENKVVWVVNAVKHLSYDLRNTKDKRVISIANDLQYTSSPLVVQFLNTYPEIEGVYRPLASPLQTPSKGSIMEKEKIYGVGVGEGEDKGVDDLKLIAKGMQFPPDVAQVVAEFVSTLPKLGKKRCESTFTELKAMYSQLCHLERTTGELYESLFVEALQEAIKHGGRSIRYVQTIIDSEIARHEEEKAAQQEDADQTRRVSESGMRGGGEFEKIGDVL